MYFFWKSGIDNRVVLALPHVPYWNGDLDGEFVEATASEAAQWISAYYSANWPGETRNRDEQIKFDLTLYMWGEMWTNYAAERLLTLAANEVPF